MFTHTFDLLANVRFQLIFLLALFAFSTTAMARETDGEKNNWQNSRTLQSDSSGLLYSLPTISQDQLRREVSQLNRQLQQRQSDLNEVIMNNRFSAADAVIIAALPGGLIYAAIKKQRIVTAEKELVGIQSQIDSLTQHPVDKRGSFEPAMLAAR
ncbi:MAG: hypothetical protein OQL20_08115 [Sedimenticola sp.]|nr:hypothetical protein [Sedimenticola sp.]